ncbi:unnamed protein product, partial [Rotaria sordida]
MIDDGINVGSQLHSNRPCYTTLICNSGLMCLDWRHICDGKQQCMEGLDEEFCEKLEFNECEDDEYRCANGMCIPEEYWLDGDYDCEWDCSDGSDEQRLFIMNDFTEHNSKLLDLLKIKKQCYQEYRPDNTPFSDICNISTEYSCLRANVDDPLNLTLNRPCINLTQIGDGTTDCLSGIDERNRLQCSRRNMLGFNFQLDDNRCVPYADMCTDPNEWISKINVAYDSVCFYRKKKFKNGTE